MPTFEDDWIAFPHPVGLIEVLERVVEERNIDPVCTSQVVPGDSVALDYIFNDDDCSSMAWSRVVTVYPATTTFPNQDGLPQQLLTFASVVELGIVRAFTVPENGEPPTPEDQYDSTRLAMADMQAMLHAICSYCDAHELPVVIGAYTPIGPQGGAVGGTWSATIGAA